MAEEAVQDTFLKVWNHAREYQPQRGALQIWLLTIARRTALDCLRLEARRPLLSDATDPEELWCSIPDAGSTEEEACWCSLYLTVQTLSPEYRVVDRAGLLSGLEPESDRGRVGLAARHGQNLLAGNHATPAPRLGSRSI